MHIAARVRVVVSVSAFTVDGWSIGEVLEVRSAMECACVGTRANPCPTTVNVGLNPFVGLGDNSGRMIAIDAGGRTTYGPGCTSGIARLRTLTR